ncbi:hypothetical protein BGX33_005345 [Mortierella sp. NVP41]|nr:hypothetical protein BGX33_005345 [Mortierella sp. NVP41]
MVSSHDGMAELGLSGDSGDIKEVQIEAEDPSHLFWVPFHMHPEIAPNAYNNWLHKHGVDASGPSTFLAVRKSSVNRRQSVLSAEYNPELDEDDESATESKATDKGPEKDKQVHDSTETDFLSGVFTAPLEQMGEPPLKTKTSLRRSLSHTRNPPPPPASDDGSVDMAAEDLATVRRTGGLTRSGPSLLRRSARTKIRRNSTASNDKNDTSRLRQTVDENGQYPAVTLVDPGPLPLPSDAPVIAVSQPETPSVADPGAVSQATDPKPLKRFVSTLRDPSKPTITTYVEPELLEQQRQEIEGVVPPKPTSTSASLNHISLADPAVYTGAVVSSITYPIPPPVKLTQNLLQHPSQKSRPSPERISQPGKQPQPRQVIPSAVPSSSASAKKSSTWSWLRGKEKEGDVLHDTKPLSQRDTPPTGPPSAPNSKTVAKKPSALSLLFSRNGKTSTKVQLSMAGPPAPVSHCDPQRNTPQDGGYVSDPCRMPIQTERAIYRLSHVKLANPRRPLHEQVLISNMMFWYLGVIEQETEIYQQRQQQQGHPQPVPMPPNHSPSEQAQQQQQQQQQQLYEVNQDPQEVVDQSPPHSSSPSTLKQKRSQPDLSTMEVRVEGSEDFVPQQDSNSHARSPGMEVFVEFIDSETVDYDEESMIGGYAEPYDWSDEEDHRKPADDNSDDGGNSVYLRSGSPVQSGFSVYSTSSLDLANGPGTVSVS